MTSCLTFEPIYQPRIWGGRDLETLFHRRLPTAGPYGEAWELVDRVEAQSVVNAGPFAGRPLHALWTDARAEVFGPGLSGDRFPLLVKIIDAAEILSVQVHPPAAVAKSLGGEPKTEVWYFAAVRPGAAIHVGLKDGATRERFEAALAAGDVSSLMDRLAGRTGDFIFIPSGRLHAIGAGNVVFEIQQNSDTTYRVYDWDRVGLDGKPRALHLKESLASINFEDHQPGLGRAQGETLVTCEHFRLERWALSAPRPARAGAGVGGLPVTQGRVRCGERLFGFGDLFLVPAAAEGVEVAPQNGGATVLRTTLPEAG